MMKYRDDQIYVENKETGEEELKTHIIHNGTTTIVFGTGEPDMTLSQRIYRLGVALTSVDSPVLNPKYVKGVAKLSPEDTYDEKTGIKIASRKAELKARVKMYNDYVTLMNMLGDVFVAVQGEAEAILTRVKKIEEELGYTSEEEPSGDTDPQA